MHLLHLALVAKPSSSSRNGLVKGPGLHLVVTYIPPRSSSKFLEEFGEFFADLVICSDKILLTGDLSIQIFLNMYWKKIVEEFQSSLIQANIGYVKLIPYQTWKSHPIDFCFTISFNPNSPKKSILQYIFAKLLKCFIIKKLVLFLSMCESPLEYRFLLVVPYH